MTDILIDAPGVVCDPVLLDQLCSVPGTSESHGVSALLNWLYCWSIGANSPVSDND